MSLNYSVEVEEVYAKDEKLKREDILEILNWTKSQPYLPEITELQAILFLHSCYYNIEAAEKTIDKYFTFRTKFSQYFEETPVDVIKERLSVNFMGVLPQRTPEGDMVVAMRVLQPNPSLYNCVDQLKVCIMILTLYLHQYGPAEGLIVLNDMEGLSFGHFIRMNLLTVKRFMEFLQEAVPVRIKALHYINIGTITEKLFTVLKPFMKKEITEKIKLHSTSLESVYEYIPKECLPQEYGGELPAMTILNEECEKNLLANLDFFKWHQTQTVDESKRLK